MSNVTLRFPLIPGVGPLKPRQISRDFQGVMPEYDSVALIARIIRDGLENAHYPEFNRLIANSDEWLVQQITLVKAVHDDDWIRNGFIPLGDWTQAQDG